MLQKKKESSSSIRYTQQEDDDHKLDNGGSDGEIGNPIPQSAGNKMFAV